MRQKRRVEKLEAVQTQAVERWLAACERHADAALDALTDGELDLFIGINFDDRAAFDTRAEAVMVLK